MPSKQNSTTTRVHTTLDGIYARSRKSADKGRLSRFSISVDNGWQKWKPEQVRAYITTDQRELQLHFDKATLESTGRSYTGKLKPKEFIRSTRPLVYSLSDLKEVDALCKTFRHIIAYAASYKSNTKPFTLSLGEERILCCTDTVAYTETALVGCRNSNFHDPDDKSFAWDEDIRKKATEEWRKKNTTIQQIYFKIVREQETQESWSLELTVDAIQQLADGLSRILSDLWRYINRHQEQTSCRADQSKNRSVQRRQLHESKGLDRIMSSLRYTFEFEPENALFWSPSLYLEDVPRLGHGGMDPLYKLRVEAYRRGELRWNPFWSVTEYEAGQDAHELDRQQRAKLKAIASVLWCWSFVACFRLIYHVRVDAPRRGRAQHVGPKPLGHAAREAEERSRGPPTT